MAESSADIESGPHRSQSPSLSEMVDYVENRLRIFAFNLALIQKAASTLVTMNFIWATVVLLGGFSQSLKSIDFWFISIILVLQSLQFLRRHSELAIRLSLYNSNFSNFSLWNANVRLIKEYSAIACIVLSSLRIHEQQYGSDDNRNRNQALNLFYWLSTVQSSMTLLGSVVRFSFSYLPNLPVTCLSEYMLSAVVGKSIYSALKDDGSDNSPLILFRHYFRDTYSRCINGNGFDVFDVFKMDFVSYSVELLQSIHHNEQLVGARLLSVLLKSDSLDSEKLRVIRTMPGVLETLIELLNWEKPQEREIRTVAGEIICKLVQIPRHRIRVMAIPESLKSITSLLGDPDQIVLGKQILKFLAEDPDNHAKIGRNRGLRNKIIALHGLETDAPESEIIQHLENTETETRTDEQDVGENSEGTSPVEAEHSDDPTSQSVDSQV